MDDPDLLLAFDLADALDGLEEPTGTGAEDAPLPPPRAPSPPEAAPAYLQPAIRAHSPSVAVPLIPASRPTHTPGSVLEAATSAARNIVVEPYSKLRVTDWEYPPAELAALLAGRVIHTLRDIATAGDSTKFMPKDPRAPADWATIGVLARKSETKVSKSDSKYQSWQLTDFNVSRKRKPGRRAARILRFYPFAQNSVTVMLFGSAYDDLKFEVRASPASRRDLLRRAATHSQ